MEEHKGAVLWGNTPMTIIGHRLEVGEHAPDFALVANDFSEVNLSGSAGKPRLISVVTSLDTSICDAQTRRFNEEAALFGDQVAIITVSAEHPLNQIRWCGAAGIDQVQVLSDHMDMNFGQAYGTWVKERRLEQRAIFVIDENDIITYIEYLPKIGEHPDYDRALEALRAAV